MTHVVRTHFIAPKELIEEVDKLVGPRRRSEFLTEATAEKLKREKLLRRYKMCSYYVCHTMCLLSQIRGEIAISKIRPSYLSRMIADVGEGTSDLDKKYQSDGTSQIAPDP